ncbi:ferrochelatase [Thermovibrio guaymasensis]|uniref:Ferrochelatase n=1 Tax=Thermovibrio guaymasensis TaxID=240167 RepID=A0A420W9J0_9BACT|nr:ferrochelatase [Thermovibrio guaymasensis]RKQ63954.1 ferrochelatase [Thermovibrio guaymasensis]
MKEAVLISYMGAPSTTEEIKPFLYRLFSDRDLINFGVPSFLQKPLAYLISTFRTPKVKPQYEAIGGGSPLVKYSLEQGELLEREIGIPVFVGMLYSEPLISKVAKEILKGSFKKVYHITLYPQYSIATAGACLRDGRKYLEGKVELKEVRSWAKNPNYVEWIRRAIKRELSGLNPKETVILFSAHSLPKYIVEERGDRYPQEVRATVEAVMDGFKEFPYRISYQSKVGPIEWLEPSTEEELRRVKVEGFKNVVVFPVSFVSEHIETLYELDVEYGELAKELSLNYKRVKLDHRDPLLIGALKEEVEKLRGQK